MRSGAFAAVVVGIAIVIAAPESAVAQVRVITSGGFEAAFREVLPDFERASGITVTTASGASQGDGPETIRAQLRRGVPADVVILSREGLAELIADDRILVGTNVDLAQALIGLAVRAGRAKPDISTVDAFRRTLLDASSVALPGSTTGIYLTKEVFPRLGITGKTVVKVTARGAESTAMVVRGEAEIAVQPVSELLHVPGLDFVGTLPAEIQYVSVFAAAVVKGSSQPDAGRRLIAFLASDAAVAAIKKSGMEPVRPRPGLVRR